MGCAGIGGCVLIGVVVVVWVISSFLNRAVSQIDASGCAPRPCLSPAHGNSTIDGIQARRSKSGDLLEVHFDVENYGGMGHGMVLMNAREFGLIDGSGRSHRLDTTAPGCTDWPGPAQQGPAPMLCFDVSPTNTGHYALVWSQAPGRSADLGPVGSQSDI